ncbi:MAG: hypothetical protein R3357_02250, partial [Burkholderiales bacterium]|nr:hypothetical protein [Burkholderiales bacterium]
MRHNQLSASATKALEVPEGRTTSRLMRCVRKVTLALCCTLVASAAHGQSTPQATTLDALRTASDRTLQAGVDRV